MSPNATLKSASQGRPWKARDRQGYASADRDDGYDLVDFIFDLAGENDDRHGPAYNNKRAIRGLVLGADSPVLPSCAQALATLIPADKPEDYRLAKH